MNDRPQDEVPQDQLSREERPQDERSQGAVRIAGGKLFSRVAILLLILCAMALGSAAGLLFVYSSDLPQIQELENYRPDVVTELYADDGTPIGSFALQRRILDRKS